MKTYTVKEVIEILSKMPQDALFVYRDFESEPDGFCSHEITDIGYIEHANEVGVYIDGQ